MEKFILDLLNGVVEVNFQLMLKVLGLGLIIFWVVVVGWVWSDSGERTSNIYARIGYLFLVLVFNVIGWIIYLIIRPSETIEEIYWSDLERRFLKYETAELGDCPKCGHQIYPGFIFCPECGFELKTKCSKCEVYVDRKYKYCPFCNNRVNYASRNEELPSTEVMEKQIQETKEEAKEVVESKQTRYKTRKDLVVKVGNRIVNIYKNFTEGIRKAALRNILKENKNPKQKESIKEEKKVVKKSKPKKKTRKKSKKK